MLNFAIINLILHIFLGANLKSLIILNCWNKSTQVAFLRRAWDHNFMVQFADLNKNNSYINELDEHVIRHNKPVAGVFIDLNCRCSVDLIKKTSKKLLFHQHNKWLIYHDEGNLNGFRTIFEHLNISIDADITYALPYHNLSIDSMMSKSVRNARTFVLYDVYNNGYRNGGKLNVTIDRALMCPTAKQGTCTLHSYLSTLHLRSQYKNRETLNDITIRMGVVNTVVSATEPESVIQAQLMTIDNPSFQPLTRFHYQYQQIVKEYLGYRTNYTYYPGWSLTSLTGYAVGGLVAEQLDLVSTPFTLNQKRLLYLVPIEDGSSFKTVCLFRMPRGRKMQWLTFFEPFHGTVWILFGLTIVITALFFWGNFLWEYRDKARPSVLTTLLIAFGSACNQGSFLVPKTWSGRLAFIMLYFACYLLYNYYTSIVVSTLLGSTVKSDIQNLGQLAESKLEVGIEPAPYTLAYLNYSTLPEVKRFVQRKINSKSNRNQVFFNICDGIRRVRDERGFVFISEVAAGYRLIERLYTQPEICDLNVVSFRPEKTIQTQMHRNSSYIEIMRQRLMRMHETGIHRRFHNYWIHTKLECYSSALLVDVGMDYTGPLFIMLLSFYVIALIVLLLELTHHSLQQKNAK